MDGRRLNSERRPPATRYEINDLKERCREKLLDFFIALRRKIEDEDLMMQRGHWMEKTDKGTTHRKVIPQGAPISPGKHLSARSRPMDRKTDAGKENEIWNPNMLWECEIGRRGVRSRTTAGASSSDSWTNQMGRPKPGADISIGNQRRTPAIRKRQPLLCIVAEEHKMQQNKGRTKGLREGRSESIRMETGRRGEREIFEPEHIYIEEATFYLASVPVVEWLATWNQKRKIEQCKGERSCPLFSGNPPPHM